MGSVPPQQFAITARGTTLPELSIALMLLALLLGLAVPTLTQLRQKAALAAAVNQMLLALNFARGVAIARGVPVAVCQSNDGEHCVAGAGTASEGFMVFVNADSDQPAQRDAGEEILRRYEIAATLALRGTRTAVNYWPAPRAGTTATFAFCDQRRTTMPRGVIVSQTGRPRSAQSNAEGGALNCP